MAEKIRKLASLAIVFILVCLVAEGFLQFCVFTPPVVLASPAEVMVVPNSINTTADTTGDLLSDIWADNATAEQWNVSAVVGGDNVYTVDLGEVMHLDTLCNMTTPVG